VALKADGTVVAWGWNGESETNVPAGLGNVIAIAAGATHNLALVSHGLPVILKQPSNQTVDRGATVFLSVSAVGFPFPQYQWQKNGVTLSDGGNLSGSAAPALELNNVQEADAASYTVIVTNAAGSVASSPAILNVRIPRLRIELDGNMLSIFWPVEPAGFALESSGNLSSAAWAPAPYVPVQIGSDYRVQVEMSGTNCFYRLRFNGP
jgi:phage baseplate assembly protein gpV